MDSVGVALSEINALRSSLLNKESVSNERILGTLNLVEHVLKAVGGTTVPAIHASSPTDAVQVVDEVLGIIGTRIERDTHLTAPHGDPLLAKTNDTTHLAQVAAKAPESSAGSPPQPSKVDLIRRRTTVQNMLEFVQATDTGTTGELRDRLLGVYEYLGRDQSPLVKRNKMVGIFEYMQGQQSPPGLAVHGKSATVHPSSSGTTQSASEPVDADSSDSSSTESAVSTDTDDDEAMEDMYNFLRTSPTAARVRRQARHAQLAARKHRRKQREAELLQQEQQQQQQQQQQQNPQSSLVPSPQPDSQAAAAAAASRRAQSDISPLTSVMTEKKPLAEVKRNNTHSHVGDRDLSCSQSGELMDMLEFMRSSAPSIDAASPRDRDKLAMSASPSSPQSKPSAGRRRDRRGKRSSKRKSKGRRSQNSSGNEGEDAIVDPGTEFSDENAATALTPTYNFFEFLKDSPWSSTPSMILDLLLVKVDGVEPDVELFCLATLQSDLVQTPVAKYEDAAHVWNQDFSFVVEDPDAELLLELYERKSGKSASLRGDVRIKLTELEHGDIEEKAVPLQFSRRRDNTLAGTSTSNVANSGGGVPSTCLFHFKLQYVPPTSSSMLTELGPITPVLPFRCRSGDILVFESSRLLSYATKIASRSRWDHVAMVVIIGDVPMLLEATHPDGAELYKFQEKIAYYRRKCNVGVRRLHRMGLASDKGWLKQLFDFLREVRGRPYETNLRVFVRAATRHSKSSGDLNRLFCSSLIAAAYQRMGLLPEEHVIGDTLPKDFGAKITQLDGARGGHLAPLVLVRKIKSKSGQEKMKDLEGD